MNNSFTDHTFRSGSVEPASLGDATTMKGAPDGGGALGRIDQYELVRELGGGGFGTVYLAKDTVAGIEVAVKGLPPLVKHNREELERIRENFALVARLHHPNIAAALTLHPAKEVVYADESVRRALRVDPGDTLMVMEYAPGVTLSKWRKQFPGGCVPVVQALEVCRQAASALDYAHGLKVVHRDVKPSNLMVESRSQETGDRRQETGVRSQNTGRTDEVRVNVKVLDFGLAAEIRSSMSRVSREQGDTSGTRPYMAPEQWAGKRQDGRTDQYALASLFYELVSGAVPFASAFDTGDPVIMANAAKTEKPDPLPILSKKQNAVLLRALAKEPSERFAGCGEFVAALGGGKISTRRNKAVGNPSRRSGGRGVGKVGSVRYWVLGLGIAAVVVVGIREKQDHELVAAQAQQEQAQLDAALSAGVGVTSGTDAAVELDLPVVASKSAEPLSTAEVGVTLAECRKLETEGNLEAAREKLLAILDRTDANIRPQIEALIGRLSIELFTTPRPMTGKAEYAIQPGDSLSKIASKFNCSILLIQKANRIADVVRIRPGDRLVIPDHPDFSVVVSKSQNTLTLLLGGRLFKKYSVGTGIQSKTPTGTFEIVDKISEPPWWPGDGRPAIPYGSPDNILGTHWLALEATGNTPKLRGYGIHGTWDDSSIGKRLGEGFIRLANHDIEELFMLVSRGTPVTITE